MVRITEIRLIDRMFLVGPPGVGKTEIIKQLAEREARQMGREFVDLRMADEQVFERIMSEPQKYYVFLRIIAPHVFPEDIGLPRSVMAQKYIEIVPLKYWKIMSLRNIAGVLFIDELTNVKREDQLSMYFSLILEKELSYGIKLSESIKVVVAGNPPDWSEVASYLPKPLRAGRLIRIEVEPPSVDEWIKYMNAQYGDAWDKRIALVLKAFPQLMITVPEGDEDHISTPRSWTMLALLLKDFDGNEELLEQLITGTVGKRSAIQVLSLLKTQVDFEEYGKRLLSNPQVFDAWNISEKILMLSHLSGRELSELNKYSKVFEKLLESNSEWVVMFLMMMNKEKRAKFLSQNTELFKKVVNELKRVVDV